MGHSMGCKLHLLIGSLFAVERAGNILISFNNFAARNSIPFAESLVDALEVEFTPSPKEMNGLIVEYYPVRRNLLIKFTNDDIDQTSMLQKLLQSQFAEMVSTHTLPGTHLTPLGTDLKWQPGAAFSPLDALGQWVRQGIYQELQHLEKTVLLWLNPVRFP
jgi:hypothetical protein